MKDSTVKADRSERGSALIIAVLITVIMSLLGISYMLMGQTENTIAENEENAAIALFVAQSGARLAVNWLNDPSSTGYLVPSTAQVDRSLRLLDTDNNPATPRLLAAAGDCTKPLYKDSTCTPGLLLDRPYRSGLADTFLGIETGTDSDPNNATKGPDLVVSQSQLDTINTTLFPNFPSPALKAKISRIEFYSPPILTLAGSATRMGVATVKVTAGVFIYPGTTQEKQIATRIVKAVVNEIPIPGPGGPLQSCADLSYNGNFQIHWGTGSSQTTASLPTGMNVQLNTGLPYAVDDPFTYIQSPTLKAWAGTQNGNAIEDPWFKYIAGAGIIGGPYNPGMTAPANAQPWPWAAGHTTTDDHSNLFQNTSVNCPTFDYSLWKSIAQSGNKNTYYYAWSSADQFLLDGTGTAVTFVNATSGKNGMFFFDTTTGTAPFGLYTNPQYPGSGSTAGYTNLTPAITIASSTGWPGLAGFLYLNSKSYGTTGAGTMGTTRTLFPPGEPGDSSGFVNLQYPGTLNGNYTIRDGTVAAASFLDPETNTRFCVDASACTLGGMTPASTPVQDTIGLPFQDTLVMDGVFYTSGTLTSSGNANYFGSAVANQGVIAGSGTPGFYFDQRLLTGGWPPKNLNLPRVVISAWETDL